MGLGKTYSTKYLVDSNGNTGAANQVLVSTATGVDWVDGSGSGIIGGPYLPLSAGSGEGLTGQLWFTGTTDANRKIFFTNAGTYAKGSMDAASYAFQVSGSEKLTILSSGNVGIGTTGPGAKLQVRIGGIGSSANNEVDGVIFEGDRHDLIYKQIRTAAATDWNSTTLRLQTRVDSTLMSSIDFVTDASYNRHIDINTASNSFNTRFTHNGRVGIGTTSPSRNGLNVFHTSGPYVHLTNTTTGDTANDGGYLSMVGTELRLGNQEAGGALSLFTNNSTGNGIYIPSNGNVGIGTTSPTLGRLQIDGASPTLAINSSNNTDSTLFMLRNSGSNGIALLKVRDGGHLSFDTGATGAGQSEKMRITSAGGVSFGSTGTAYGTSGQILKSNANASPTWVDASTVIGGPYLPIANPTFTGTLSGPTLSIQNQINTTSSNLEINYQNGDGTTTNFKDFYVRDGKNATILTLIGSTKAATFKGTVAVQGTGDSYFQGNVGIGITSPGAKLDVYNSSGNVYQAFIGGSVSKLMINGNLSGGGVALQSAAANSSSDYSICPSTVYDLFMQSCGGNVMIGSGTPTAKLEVNGQTKTKSLTYLEPTGNSEYRGEIVYFGAFESGIFDTNGGELVCLGNVSGNPTWRKADDNTATRATGMLGITLGSTVAAGVLVRGFARSTAYNGFADGGKCYISATDGDMTTTAPTGNNKYLRIVGYVVDSITGAAEIYFCPDNTYVQITV